jgi:hypothetical protein
LDHNPAILVDDQHVCYTSSHGANCHTWGCDVRVYRQTVRGWEKILDEPVEQLFLSTSNNSAFILGPSSGTCLGLRCRRLAAAASARDSPA